MMTYLLEEQVQLLLFILDTAPGAWEEFASHASDVQTAMDIHSIRSEVT